MRLILFIFFTFIVSAVSIRSTQSLSFSSKLEAEDNELLNNDCESLDENGEDFEAKQDNKTGVSLRIAGGYDAKPGQFPSYVSTRRMKNFVFDDHCAGVLISDQLVLTAAHCLDKRGFFEKIEVATGIWGPSAWDSRRVTLIKVDKVCVSKKFGPDWTGQDQYDFAVMRLTKKVELNKEVNVACLPDKPLPFGARGFTLGTGKENTFFPTGKLKVLPTEHVRCHLFSIPQAHFSRSCFKSTNNGDTCQGDSGGPTIVEVDGKQCVYGLTSYTNHEPCNLGPDQIWASANVYASSAEIKQLMNECLS